MPKTLKRQVSVSLNITKYGNSADELRRAMNSVPDGATYDVSTSNDIDYGRATITFKWEEEL